MRRFHAFRLLALAALAISGGSADDAPPWLREVLSRDVPTYPPNVPAVVLMQDVRVVVEPNGHAVTNIRKVVRILNREGRGEAIGTQTYQTANGKIRDAHAWMVAPTGTVFKLGREDTNDRGYATGNVYEDVRVRELNGRPKADPGGVFAYEFAAENEAPFAQFNWYFQARMPVVSSRYSITVPEGWNVQSKIYNHTPKDPVVQGKTYMWELEKLPFIPEEPSSPHLDSLVPRISVTCVPAPGAKALPIRTFSSWKDVSQWMTDISEAQAEPNTAITEKAQALTANIKNVAPPYNLEYRRIYAVAEFLQSMRYVSIPAGGFGAGYRPRAASETLSKEYGDGKDKATLMRAMLKALGVRSYLVSISGADRNYVREDWPSPQQFDHTIVAVEVPASIVDGPVIDHPKLGHLLFFDPTNGSTSFGDLSRSQQGGFALIVAGEQGGLVRVPMMRPSFNLVSREVQATIDESGMLSSHLHEELHGQAAATERNNAYAPRPDFQKFLEQWLTRGAKGATISKQGTRDYRLEKKITLDVDFQAPNYAQRQQGGKLLVFRPIVAPRRDAVFLTNPERVTPALFNPAAWTEVARFKIPEGFKVDETPDPEKLQSPFGRYSASCEMKDGELVFTRSWETEAASIPVEQYAALREYYRRISQIEQAPVVLMRK
ncbi:MAG TPA: DUF3857 domain-containing protein [Bryobacteraceae bacterium]|nr:DUF3857 domain-containing protein [Bryobacteraceae bacterium]